jgi:hypothetical protein
VFAEQDRSGPAAGRNGVLGPWNGEDGPRSGNRSLRRIDLESRPIRPGVISVTATIVPSIV